jgi:coenzyme F420-0:L-glutamate ligase/coenzyme F420-1:gamma-L-glutamate ligase
MSNQVQLIALQGFPLVEPGHDLNELIIRSLADNGLQLESGDVLVLAQKIVSKAEGRYARLSDVEPGAQALELAAIADKDPRQVEWILRESTEVLRVRPGVIIVQHRLGYVHANAGIDKSNLPASEGDPELLLLPEDPDASAARLLAALSVSGAGPLAVIINDSAGRAWRNGTVGIAIGSAGIEPVDDRVGDPDLYGQLLEITEVAIADELAASASLLMGPADEAYPVVLVRGARWQSATTGSAALIRDRELDLFR